MPQQLIDVIELADSGTLSTDDQNVLQTFDFTDDLEEDCEVDNIIDIVFDEEDDD